MFCGFGAVVLLVMLLHGETLQRREEKQQDLKAELARVNLQLDFARNHLAEQQAEMENIANAKSALQSEEEALRNRMREQSQSAADSSLAARERARAIAALQRERAQLEASKKQRELELAQQSKQGGSLIGFDGDGRRQYLTGLKLGGERTLILIDRSASMLDETIVNIVRRKLMSKALRQDAPKWQRTLRTLHWLIANLQPNKRFQVYAFNTEAQPVIEGTAGQWLSTSDPGRLSATLTAIRKLAPEHGTSLHNAFDVIRRLTPRPDSVLLLTDGLPTQGKKVASAASITGEKRLSLFADAVTRLLPGVPINTLLFPIEGDPAAAAAYWALAIQTDGAFITPSRDWP